MYKFFAYLNRMKYINRWGLMHSNVNENVMEHSQQVAVVAHALATISNVYFGGKLNADRIATMALFHETSEVLTGDLPTPIKYFNPQIRTSYKALERLANDKLLGTLPPELAEVYRPVLDETPSRERQIVKYADKICAYVKCLDELKLGNGEFAPAEKTLLGEITAFDSPEVEWFMTNVLPAYKLSLDELERDD